VGVDHQQLRANIEEMRAASVAEGHSFSLTFCLMLDNWHELADVLAWGDRLDCDVFTNTVTNPPRFSLHHAPAAEISAILAAMERSDPECRQRLGRNLPVWDQALHQVRALCAHRNEDDQDRAEPAMATARRLATATTAGPAAWMEVGDDLLIAAIGPDPSNVFGLDLRHLVGEHSISFLETLGPTLGRLDATTLELATGGVELRRFSFTDATASHEVAAAMARRPGGETWHITLRTTPSRVTPVRLLSRRVGTGS
jgi:hypothetical protein